MKPNLLHILKECMAKTHHQQERDLPAVVAAYDFSGRRFLLVDDNALNREIAVALLTEVGGVVDEAEDGRQAVEIFAAATGWKPPGASAPWAAPTGGASPLWPCPPPS